MGSGDKDVALRKRQQIDSSKRTMFIFVAVAAFVSGIALVVSFFLVQQIWFQGRVISQKQATVNTINANLKAVDGLKDNIRLLDTNEALKMNRCVAPNLSCLDTDKSTYEATDKVEDPKTSNQQQLKPTKNGIPDGIPMRSKKKKA